MINFRYEFIAWNFKIKTGVQNAIINYSRILIFRTLDGEMKITLRNREVWETGGKIKEKYYPSWREIEIGLINQ